MIKSFDKAFINKVVEEIQRGIDYFRVNKEVIDRILKSTIYTDVLGSDHCPIGIELKEV